MHTYTSQIIVSKYCNINHKSSIALFRDLWLIFKYLETIICDVQACILLIAEYQLELISE